MDRNPTIPDKRRDEHGRAVGILCFPGATLLDITGPSEVFGLADRDLAGPRYRTVLLSPAGGPVRTSSGVVLAGTLPAHEAPALDTLIVAGGQALAAEKVDPDLLRALRRLVPGSERVASVCTGAFLLAQLGLLDGRRATTHWRHAEAMGRRFPRVQLSPGEFVVADGPYLTSAGITAGIDLALRLVETDHGQTVARAVAQEMVMFVRRPGGQLQFTVIGEEAGIPPAARHADMLEALRRVVVHDPAGHHDAEALSRRAGMSSRHLSRIFREELGTTPKVWVEDLRIDGAKALLLAGCNVTEAARSSGFGSDETLRRVFSRRVGVLPSEYRARFTAGS